MRKSIADLSNNNPRESARARQAVREYDRLVEDLTACRALRGLSQTQVAVLMGTKQSAVSDFESSRSNPTIDTIQRYAAAVGSVVEFKVQMPAVANRQWDDVVKFCIQGRARAVGRFSGSTSSVARWGAERVVRIS